MPERRGRRAVHPGLGEGSSCSPAPAGGQKPGLRKTTDTPLLGRQPLRAGPAGTCGVSPSGRSRAGGRTRAGAARGAGCPRRALGGRPRGLRLRPRSPKRRPRREPATRGDRSKVQGYLRCTARPGRTGLGPGRPGAGRWVCCAADGSPGSPRGRLRWKWEGWGGGTRGAPDCPSEPALSAYGRCGEESTPAPGGGRCGAPARARPDVRAAPDVPPSPDRALLPTRSPELRSVNTLSPPPPLLLGPGSPAPPMW